MLLGKFKYYAGILVVADAAGLVIVFVGTYVLRNSILADALQLAPLFPWEDYLPLLIVLIPVWLGLLFWLDGYSLAKEKYLQWAFTLSVKITLGGIVVFAAYFFLSNNINISRTFLLLCAVFNGLMIFTLRGMLYIDSKIIGKYVSLAKNLLVVGTKKASERVLSSIQGLKDISPRTKLLLSVGVALVLIAAIFHIRAKEYEGTVCLNWADQGMLMHQMEQFETTGYPHGGYLPGYMVLTLGLEKVTGIRDHCRAMSLLNGVLFAISLLATLAIGLRMGASIVLLIIGMIVLVFGSNALLFNWIPWTHWVPIGFISAYVLAISYTVDNRNSTMITLIASATLGFLSFFLLWSRTYEAAIILFALMVSCGRYLFLVRPVKRRSRQQVVGFIVGVVLCGGLMVGTLGKVIPEIRYGKSTGFEHIISSNTIDFRVIHHKFIQLFIHSGHYNLWEWTPFSVGNLLRPPLYPRREGELSLLYWSAIQPILNQNPVIFLYLALGILWVFGKIRRATNQPMASNLSELRQQDQHAVRGIPGIFCLMVGLLIATLYTAPVVVGSVWLKYVYAREFMIIVPLTVALMYILQPTRKQWGVIFFIGLGLVLVVTFISNFSVKDLRGVSPKATVICWDHPASPNYACRFRYAFTRTGKEIPFLPGKTYFKISVRNKGLPQNLTRSLLACAKTKYEEICRFELPRTSPPRTDLVMVPAFSVLGNMRTPEMERLSIVRVPIQYASTK